MCRVCGTVHTVDICSVCRRRFEQADRRAVRGVRADTRYQLSIRNRVSEKLRDGYALLGEDEDA